MQKILLTGAGFSRNWGGWLANEMFEFLLGCPEVMQSDRLRRILWRHQRDHSGFESALGELRVSNAFACSDETLSDLRGMERAVASAFEHMNARFWEMPFESTGRPITAFLSRFDSIFTLNQDLLLDYHYNPATVFPANGLGWRGIQFPGMSRLPTPGPAHPHDRPDVAYIESQPLIFEAVADMQPVYKLHGSYGWAAADRDTMLIMGDDKERDIAGSTVLNEYLERFAILLTKPNTRLMVVGYSFRDNHINQAITRAVTHHGLRLFIIDPRGTDFVKQNTPPPTAVSSTTLGEVFESSIIGASRRNLGDIFSNDQVEHAKLMRFFA